MSNLLVYFGEEKYLSRQKLTVLVDAYKQKVGDLNFAVFDGDGATAAEIISQAKSLPFLAEKRLIVVRDFFGKQKEAEQVKMATFLGDLPETTVLAIWEDGKPRSKSFQKVLELKNCKAEECPKLDNLALGKWVQQEVGRQGGKISIKAANQLLSLIGDNLPQLETEIGKLVSYEPEVSVAAIEALVSGNRFSNVFDMVDAFGARNPQKALLEMHKIFDSGENEMYVLSMIIRQFRNIVMVKDLKSKGLGDKEIAGELKLHPFVVKKTGIQASAFSFSDLKDAYASFVAAETKIKTGEEPRLVLDLLANRLRS